jgi:hypothetical protein
MAVGSKTNIFFPVRRPVIMGTSSYFVVGEAKTNAVPVPINALEYRHVRFLRTARSRWFRDVGELVGSRYWLQLRKIGFLHTLRGTMLPFVTLEVSNADPYPSRSRPYSRLTWSRIWRR